MSNSFTFKNPKRVGCYHSIKADNMSFVVEYKNWHWRYEATTTELVVHLPLNPRKSYKRKPVYEKGNINWEATKPDLMDINIYKDSFNIYLCFKQKVDNFYGDGIMTICQSMQGFWQEFRELLKQCKTCDPIELNDMLNSNRNFENPFKAF